MIIISFILKVIDMSRVCKITNKKPLCGHNVSHSQVKTSRRFLPNLQNVSFLSDILGASVKMCVSSHGLKTVEVNGGIDSYLLNTPNSKLTDEAKVIKNRILKCQQKRSK